tara:strand:- start:107 stop:715 length:609 start_codon:yes stop_codon:yes gene_type:complete
MTYVSLGASCSIAYNLKKFDLRNEAYPFDWTRTLNLNNICKAIDNEFKDFLNLNKFELKKLDESFFIEGNKCSYIYKNDYCSFYHDFYDEITKIDVNTFKQKYKRRIVRFLELLKSDKEIIFIREQIGKLNVNKINNLIKSLNNYNKNMNYKIIIITNDINYKNININKIYFYFSDVKVLDWKRCELNWEKLFFIFTTNPYV